jgi:hypothetical protein
MGSGRKSFGGQHVRIAQYALAGTVVGIVVDVDTKGPRGANVPRIYSPSNHPKAVLIYSSFPRLDRIAKHVAKLT